MKIIKFSNISFSYKNKGEKMNNKHVKLSLLFLTLLFLMLGVATVSAGDVNDAADVSTSQDTGTQTLVSQKAADDNIKTNTQNIQTDLSNNNLVNSTDTITKSSLKDKSSKMDESELKDSYFDLENDIDVEEFIYQKTITLEYSLLGDEAQPIANSPVKAVLNNNQTFNYETDETGGFVVSFKADVLDLNNLTLTYDGNDEYLPATESVSFYIQRETIIECDEIDNVVVGTPANITGRLVGADVGLGGENIFIIVDYSDEYQVTTDNDGYFSVSHVASDIGSIIVEYIYDGNIENLPSSNSTAYFVTYPVQITVNCTESVYEGEKINITGRLRSDEDDIAFEEVTVTVAGEEYTVVTDDYGYYQLEVTATRAGNNTIVASFAGNTYLDRADATAVCDVLTEKNTILTVGSTKTVYVGDKVSIYGKLTGDGQNIPYAMLKISVEGTTYNVTTSQYGNYNLKINNQEEGTKTITVTYDGTDSYNSNIATTTFNAVQKVSYLTLGSSKSAYVGDQISVYGKLTVRGFNVAYAPITVTVDGNQYNVTTSQYGNYNLKVNTSQSGNRTITAYYAGTKTYSTAINRTTFMSNMKTSVLTIGSTKSAYVGDQISVYGKLTVRGFNVAYARITVTVDGKQYNVTTSQYGNYNLKVSSLTAGNNTITAYYAGTYVYASSTNNTTYIANKKVSVLTLGASKTVKNGNNVSVYGKLTVRGYNIPNATIQLTVNGHKFTVVTSQYGNYNFKLNTVSTGVKNVVAYYAGTTYYASVTNTTTYTVIS